MRRPPVEEGSIALTQQVQRLIGLQSRLAVHDRDRGRGVEPARIALRSRGAGRTRSRESEAGTATGKTGDKVAARK